MGVSSAQFLRLLLCCLYVTEVSSWYGSDGTVVEVPYLWFKDFTLELDGKFDLKHAIIQSGVRACAKGFVLGDRKRNRIVQIEKHDMLVISLRLMWFYSSLLSSAE